MVRVVCDRKGNSIIGGFVFVNQSAGSVYICNFCKSRFDVFWRIPSDS